MRFVDVHRAQGACHVPRIRRFDLDATAEHRQHRNDDQTCTRSLSHHKVLIELLAFGILTAHIILDLAFAQ